MDSGIWRTISSLPCWPLTVAGVEPHKWIRERREDKGIRQADVEERTALLGPRHRVSQSHLSKIEKGRAPLIGLGPERMDALRQVLGISPAEWTEQTGLQIVASTFAATLTPPPTEPLPLPDELLEAVSLYGKRFPELTDPKWQQFLASFRARGMEGDTPEDWLDLYRNMARHGIQPEREG